MQRTAEIRAPEIRLGKSSSCILGNAVPAVVNGEGAGSASGFGDAAGLGVVKISGRDRAHGGGDLPVFGIPDEGAVGCRRNRQRIGGGVAVIVIRRTHAGHRAVLVERVAGVVIRAEKRQAVGTFFPVAD